MVIAILPKASLSKVHQLLFLKAYALENMEARDLTVIDEGLDCCKSKLKKKKDNTNLSVLSFLI